MSTPFHEEELNLGILYGTQGGPEFSTDIVINSAGFEQSTSVWSNARGSWQLGNRTINKTEANYITNFFRSKLGRGIGFRFKDYSDYYVTDEIIGVGNGTSNTFQIVKKYTALASTIETRDLKKIVGNTLVVKLNGTPTLAYSVNTTTGVLVLDSPPSSGVIITVSCEFRIPVRFNTDKLEMSFIAYDSNTTEALFSLGDLTVVEIRV